MVAAVDQLLGEGSPRRLIALGECSLWTGTLGMAVLALGLGFAVSPSYPAGLGALAGGLLLGLGAWLNGACVFGSIARIGGRDWHYLLTPPGFFAGSLLHSLLLGAFPTRLNRAAHPIPMIVFVMLIAASIALTVRRIRLDGLSNLWDWRHATIAIGFAFVVLTALAGPWTYSEALARAAHAGALPAWQDAALFAALLGGAIIGGSAANSQIELTIARAAACFGGGALMGFGGSLVPGGNDNLILVGLPALQPHAWLAIAAMVVAIAGGLLVSRGYSRLRRSRTESRAEPV
jgi:toxin CptA